ncbi:hypothetical protein SAMN06265350_102176 [Solitalea koreensis]|uniref:Uncharacterized protein n=1 Tax=Solitalea koreensis TaxID=543615 RepID=A0A521BG89_9SPHI|nr:hypothetical protein SAMN06265350_102176 [Solitalea koreensis]
MEEIVLISTENFKTTQIPTDPEFFKGINPFQGGCCGFKKCCKKYKKGKACRSCPKK